MSMGGWPSLAWDRCGFRDARGGGGARGSTGSKSNLDASQRWHLGVVSQSKSYISRKLCLLIHILFLSAVSKPGKVPKIDPEDWP